MEFTIKRYTDGEEILDLRMEELSLPDAVDELLFFQVISNKFSEEKLFKYLRAIKIGTTVKQGKSYQKITITRDI
tara:strand:+ start:1130 stop:1354 length:225 start_codon:yes stop_codon:yes gene_type:complete